MHAAAFEWVTRFRSGDPLRVLDIGGRDINGTPAGLYPAAQYTVLDIRPDEGVHIVADAATWDPGARWYDLVLCCEVFEHTAVWREILATAYRALRPGGELVTTCAGPGRASHSALDGGSQLWPGEWYGNVEPGDLKLTLEAVGFRQVTVVQQGADVYSYAVKGEL